MHSDLSLAPVPAAAEGQEQGIAIKKKRLLTFISRVITKLLMTRGYSFSTRILSFERVGSGYESLLPQHLQDSPDVIILF